MDKMRERLGPAFDELTIPMCVAAGNRMSRLLQKEQPIVKVSTGMGG
jgi:hypothetical protein